MSSRDQCLTHLRKRLAQAPREPGVYRWKDKDGVVLYVGKAKNLRDRLKSYIGKGAEKGQGPWKLALLQQICDVEFTMVSTELEALVLETNLIKQCRPKYNVLMKDDKNYVYVRVGVNEDYPTASILRRMDDDDAKYFGPFTSAWETRQMLDVFHAICPYRACRASLAALNREKGGAPSGRPCLEYQIGRCCGLCVGAVSQQEYRSRIDRLMSFLRGDRAWVMRELERRMQEAALAKKFESAGKLRDQLRILRALEEDQIVSDTSGEDLDIVGTAVLSGRAHVVILLERGGKVVGERSFALQGRADGIADVLEQFLPQYYSETQDLPQAVIVAEEFPSQNALAALLSQAKDARVEVRVPERGKKSHLLQLAEKNAAEKARQQDISWEADARNVEDGLEGLQKTLGLREKPRRIEGYDISHLGGTQTVGSMVVLKDGKPLSDHYRHFVIRTLKKGNIDDYAALKEVLTRRLRHLAPNGEEEQLAAEGITVGKAKKSDQTAIEKIHADNPGDVGGDGIDYRDYIVARFEQDIVASGRLFHYPEGPQVIRSVWVEESYRGQKLGHVVVRRLLKRVKKGKVYVHAKSSLQEYYGSLGFLAVHKPPAVLQKKMDDFHAHHPEAAPTLIMMCEAARLAPDISLKTTPDLLLIDGGKGQLAVAVGVLKTFGLAIPVASLAKRAEELFQPGEESPAPLSADSPPVLLLRRLRDESHRFANRLREKRLSKDLQMQVEAAMVGPPPTGEER